MRYFVISTLALALVFTGALSGAPDTHAASIYDEHIITTDTLTVDRPDAGTTSDWTDRVNLFEDLWTADAHSTQVCIDVYKARKASGGSWYAVEDNSNSTGKRVHIFQHETPNIPLIWNSTTVELKWMTMVTIQMLADGTEIIQCQYQDAPNVNDQTIAWKGQTWFKTFGSTYNANYPPDYAGTSIPGEYGGNGSDPIDEKPNIKMDSLSKWEASFSDQNFYTFDNVPFLCGDGFPPRITMEIWDRTNGVKMLVDTVSANSKLDYTFPNKTRDMNYEIVAWYHCTDGTEFVEPGASFYAFTIDRNGNLVAKADVAICMQETYPFVMIEGCLANMKQVTEALSFGTVRVGAASQWSFTEGCHQLGTIGDWMNLENRSVCPAIPSYVRNVVTPFITFAMGLMTVKFITRQGGNSF